MKSKLINYKENTLNMHTSTKTEKNNKNKIYEYFNKIRNNLKNIDKKLKDEYSEEIKNIENTIKELSEILEFIKKIDKKNKINILFLWLIWILNFSIFINEEFRVLFFSNLNNTTLIFMIIFFFFFALIETLNIKYKNLKNGPKTLSIIFICIYFIIVILSFFKSLIFVKGFGWQFYLLLVLTNFSTIINLKFNIIYKNEENNNDPPFYKNYNDFE